MNQAGVEMRRGLPKFCTAEFDVIIPTVEGTGVNSIVFRVVGMGSTGVALAATSLLWSPSKTTP